MSQGAAETYTPGHGANAVAFMAERRAATHAGFFVALLRGGMRLLDCGCGPGAITLDLARIVRPGPVIGMDRDGVQFAAAREMGAREGLALSFETGSVYALPFSESSFDAVFAHALFEHLAEPLRAAVEIRRVLKPGGFCGLRSPDWGGFLLHPLPEDTAAAIRHYEAMMTANGGDVQAAQRIRQEATVLNKKGLITNMNELTYYFKFETPGTLEIIRKELELHG
jgi:ubiquinone/menaquinone biosynthesis C-methylase UbiE